MKFRFYIYLFILHFFSCKEQLDYIQVLSELKISNANIQARIKNKVFYESTHNTFKGEVLLNENAIRINVTDDNKSNVILSLISNEKIKNGIRIKIDLDNQSNNSLMIGKLINEKTNKGLGYLMAEGEVIIDKIDKEKLIISFNGKAAEFLEFNDKSKWKDIKGHIIMKEPNYQILGSFDF